MCRVGGWLCALRLSDVVEIMRPLPLRSIEGAPSGIAGLALIRGRTCPVVDFSGTLGSSPADGRFVLIRLGPDMRYVALAVSEVGGVSSMELEHLERLPPLLSQLDEDRFEAFSVLDEELCAVLNAAALVDERTWAEVARNE